MLLATIIVTLATQLHTDAGFTGATLVTLMTFGEMLATIVQSYTTLETSIGAVALLKTFSSSTEQESKPDVNTLPAYKWPQSGHIDIKNVWVSYGGKDVSDREAIALQDVSVTFHPGKRVAIVGRTGNGKSSLLLLLLRLVDPLPVKEPSSGLTVDKFSLDEIDRDLVRRHIIAVSQDPVFLPSCPGSTLRITRLRSGAKKGILLLDEVSSSVDSQTNDKMWKIIEDEFVGYTVIMVVHRLDMAFKCNPVVVMEQGRVAESGQPDDLCREKDAAFKRLIDATEAGNTGTPNETAIDIRGI
ncbi:abc transporter [Fusarium beomiforme]|uniref:Abc transporter n=1 Tax=Fusarium beomiforme TaxID=44412 RepID=A0A9P5A2L3_9HYPO|nr:abc transporter [Fusarium beomiforme]